VFLALLKLEPLALKLYKKTTLRVIYFK
jgi:hypothetical protein